MPMTRNDARSSVQIRKLTYSALYLAIALVLPFLTGQIPEIGSMLCPMHIPALLCGFVCGWPWGLAVGFVSPLLRSLLFGMPTAYTAVAMAFELAAYGAVSGILYRIFPRRNWSVYVTLIAAMIVGRLVWGCVQFMMAGLQHTVFDRSLFLAGAVTNALPGILVQIILIPILVITMEKAKLTLNGWTACTGYEPYSGFPYKQTATLVPDNSGAPTVTADSTFTSGIQFIKTGIIATDEILGEVQDAINDDGLSVTGYGTVTVYVQEKPTAEINARWQITT